jgi:hypothetical protein
MGDTIIGISVLQETWVPQIFKLWFRAQKSTGEKAQGWIFIRDAAHNHLPEKFLDYPEGTNYIWKFTKQGNELQCTPSVNWISWNFHNGGQWSTQFIEAATKSEPWEIEKTKPEAPRYTRGSAIHYDLNWIEGIDQQKLISDLQAQGYLR